ncbi:protein LONGIFOLIA 2-like protein [Cinnamomum micranthum f. kanehirae]|uniref:Protein LONGIFOLIA 2-like protein n=1 Tax=Cinnamomum micranthum f. kanehirae TaxID=337451 RepID=A0A443N2V8_9MAGN|nr:protein LONGIFOLIA 2-like protein [Cinnamomum micranthum f. kanehirae]
MSEEHLQESTEEHLVLKKQSGCMTAIFHLFESRRVVPSKRVRCHILKRLPPGHSHLNDGNLREQAIASPRKPTDKNSSKRQNDQRNSIDSCGASLSSSTCSSCFPSHPVESATLLECSIVNSRNADVNCNPTSHVQSPNCHSQSSRDSILFRDVIKDSIYGGRWSSVENTNRELEDHVLRHKDFLKPLQQPQSRDGTYVAGIGGKLRTSMGNESPRIQDKLIEASYCHGNAREFPRSSCEVSSGSLFQAPLHTRRFSYDGQDILCTSSVSRETSKSVMKLKEFPRLSLDSRECSMRSFNYNLKTNRILEDLKQSSIEGKVSNNGHSNVQQELGTFDRYPSVVAKLMGLEAKANSSSVVHGQIGPVESHADEVLVLSDGESRRRIKESRHHQCSESQRSPSKGHISPRRRNSEVMKPILSSRSQIETATLRQRDRSCSPRTRASRNQDTHADEPPDVFYGELSRKIKESKQNQSSGSPRNSFSGHISPQQINSEIMKPILRSKSETTPLRQQDTGGIETTLQIEDVQVIPKNPLSVYGEMEKRFEELEFQQSSRDLRALKHILKATQVKGCMDTKEAEASDHVSHKNYDSHNKDNFDQCPNLENRKNSKNYRLIASPPRRTTKESDFRLPKASRRPELIEKSSISNSSVMPLNRSSDRNKFRTINSVDRKNVSLNNQTRKGPIPKLAIREYGSRIFSPVDKKTNGWYEAYRSQKPRLRSIQDSSRPQTSTRENVGSLTGSSGSLSPRTQQRKIELEKRCHLPTCSEGLSKPSKQQIVQPAELGSPGRKQRPKLDYLQKNDGRSSELCNEVHVTIMQSQCNIIVGSERYREIMSPEKTSEIHHTSIQHGYQSPRRAVVDDTVLSLEQKKSMLGHSKDGFSVEFIKDAFEKPSPVSVLDVSFYENGLPPSPVKKASNSFQSEEEWGRESIDSLSYNMRLSFISRIKDKKLENIECLVRIPRGLDLDNLESTSDFGSLCEDRDPDYRYISEILLASGLLDEDHNFSSVATQLHPSGHLINPNVFMALEEMKAGSTFKNLLQSKFNKEKLHRKLVFDTVNEILTRRLETEAEPWLQVNKLAGSIPFRRPLVRELCREIDWHQAGKSNNLILGNDVIFGLERWVDFRKESSRVVLDIERMIFKDMIDEIIRQLAHNTS